ncbi:MAG: hypothetical protein ACMUHM_09075 [Thermoplasmatota archaeon]
MFGAHSEDMGFANVRDLTWIGPYFKSSRTITDRDFNGGVKTTHIAFFMTVIVYTLIILLLIVFLPVYITDNPEMFGSGSDVFFFIGFIFFMVIVSLPMGFLLTLAATAKVTTGMIFRNTIVSVNNGHIEVNYILEPPFEEREKYGFTLPFSYVEKVRPLSEFPIWMKISLRVRRLISFGTWSPEGSMHHPLIPLGNIIVLDLISHIDYPRYITGKARGEDHKVGITDRLFIEIRRKDQKRFFSLIRKSG